MRTKPKYLLNEAFSPILNKINISKIFSVRRKPSSKLQSHQYPHELREDKIKFVVWYVCLFFPPFSSKLSYRTQFFESELGQTIRKFYTLFSASHTKKKAKSIIIQIYHTNTLGFRYKFICLRLKIKEPSYAF